MKKLQQGTVSRARWAALGAAVAVSLGVGGVAVTSAVVNTGERTAFIPITPCRLFDTRPSNPQIGPRATPLAAHEVYSVQVTGVNGNCTIPADASAVAMNVTTVDGTGSSFLTIWPADVAQPQASSLNWVPGSPPTPNKVDVKLSATGSISLYNDVGTVNVLADVVGYYADHNHDDRYYTKEQINGMPSSSVIAGAGVNSDASISTAFPRFGTTWTITKTGVGLYSLAVPGLNPGCHDPLIPLLIMSTIDGQTGAVGYGGVTSVACLSGNTNVSIRTVNSANAATDRPFQFIAYRPGNGQILPASAHPNATECTSHPDGTVECV